MRGLREDGRRAEHRLAARLRRARRQGLREDGPDLTRGDLAAAGGPLERCPLLFETSLPRVFAVGDVRAASVKRVAGAVREGSVCVQLVHKVLAE